jgi:hypothetical protein
LTSANAITYCRIQMTYHFMLFSAIHAFRPACRVPTPMRHAYMAVPVTDAYTTCCTAVRELVKLLSRKLEDFSPFPLP